MGIYGHKFDAFRSDLHPELLEEFDLKGSIENIKKTLKRAIISLINKIDEFLDRCKDSKIKSICKNLLSKLRNLLTKSDHMSRMEEFEKAKKEVNEYGKEFENIRLDNGRFREAIDEAVKMSMDIYHGRTTLSEVKEKIKEMKQKYGNSCFNSYQLEKEKYPRPWTKQTINDLNILSISGASSEEFYLFFATVADEVYGH